MSTQTKSSSRPWLVFIGCCVLSLVGFGLIVNTLACTSPSSARH